MRFPGRNDRDHDEDQDDHDHSDHGCDDPAHADRAECDGVAATSSNLFLLSVVVRNHGIKSRDILL